MDEIAATFEREEAATGSVWRLRVISYPDELAPEFGSAETSVIVNKPNFDELSDRMREEHAGYTIRTYGAGKMDVNARGRSAPALRAWLVELLFSSGKTI